MQIIGFDDRRVQAQALSKALESDSQVVYQEISRHTFPDGESLVQVGLEKHVVLNGPLAQRTTPSNRGF